MPSAMRGSSLVLVLFTLGCGVDLERDPFTGACGPAAGGDTQELQSLPSGLLLTLGIAADFSSSSIDALAVERPGVLDDNRLVGAGDAALRKVGDQAVLLGRGVFSNLQLVDGGTYPGPQASLGTCNPHDIELLDDCRALVTCYDRAAAKLVDLATGEVSEGPDLSPLADGDGLPEMDQITRAGDVILISLQRLDRDAFYTPAGPGLVAELDAATLTLLDRDAEAEGVQALVLPCQNPFTDFAALPGGALAVACAGDFMNPATAGLAVIDPTAGTTSAWLDGAGLQGSPAALRVDTEGRALLLVSAPDAFAPTEMLLVRLPADGPAELLYDSPGFSLSGLAVSADGTIYVGDRSASSRAGVWALTPGGGRIGPIKTSLPPYELEVW